LGEWVRPRLNGKDADVNMRGSGMGRKTAKRIGEWRDRWDFRIGDTGDPFDGPQEGSKLFFGPC